jgi:CRP-like cAMP-binding protein
VFLIRSGEFELNKPLLIDNNKENRYNIKVALLGRGEMIGEDEVISRQPYKNTCVCYSGFGEILLLSAQNFLLKFYQKPESQEVVKRKIKNEFREERVKKFRIFLNSPKEENNFVEENFRIRKHLTSKIRRLSESVKYSFSPLNSKQIEEIKKKALGFEKKEKVYIVFNSPISSMNTEENDRSPTVKVNSSRSILEMKVHQPGGYYRSKLKKPRNLSSDLKILYKK